MKSYCSNESGEPIGCKINTPLSMAINERCGGNTGCFASLSNAIETAAY
jgi:hypothetical protein